MSTQLTPLISIITPTFNHEKYIGPCIQSVLKQAYQNWELIIVDDGSTDRTADAIRSFEDPRIRYLHQENQGIESLAHTYNHAFNISNGELIAILEGDDMWPPEKLSRLVPEFIDEGIILAYGSVADISSNGEWAGRLSRSVRRRMRLSSRLLTNDPLGEATRYMLRADGVDLIPPSTVIIRRSALEAINGFQYVARLCVTDYPTFLRLSLLGKFYYTSEIMGWRRRHLASATAQNLAHIVLNAREYVTKFLDENVLVVSKAERDAIEKTWHRPNFAMEFTEGRIHLLNGEWKDARSHFWQALEPSMPQIFFAAFAGWCLSWLHCDLEVLLSIAGVARLKNETSIE